jgi:hypothetical protein
MEAYFNRKGLPSAIVDGDTLPSVREARIDALNRGDLCCLFTVDVFNEGVDIPQVDTVLFLRPTESATIFLQQLGRGLRLHEEKACLTVLDFVGTAHRDFRFDLRFRALLGGGTRVELKEAVEQGFPRLPSGCAIELERRAQAVILENLRRKLTSWASLAEDVEPGMTLGAFLARTSYDLQDVYRNNHTFSELRHRRGLVDHAPTGPIARALQRTLHTDDVDRLTRFRLWLDARPPEDPVELFAALGGEDLAEMPAFFDGLYADPVLLGEVRELFEVLDDRRRHPTFPLDDLTLRVHAHYTRNEVSAALGLVTERGKLLSTQAGVYKCEKHRCDLFFVTLEKDEKEFTPTTLYRDYAVSPTVFHWQSQSVTREDSETGRRYRDPPEGWRLLLVVRRAKGDERGETMPFLLLGPVRYAGHEGERPMSITWRLDRAVPGDWFQQVKVAAG